MEPSDPQTPTIRICVIVGDFFIMNTLRSHLTRFSNNWVIVQQKLRTIHETLLQCLEAENALAGRHDYVPGKVHLVEENVWNGKSVLSRLMVSRNGIEIFRPQLVFPEQIILATLQGKYEILAWLEYSIRGTKKHIPYKQVPFVLEKFAQQWYTQERGSNIQFSLVS